MNNHAAAHEGAILFELRHRSGLSQSRLSTASGVSVRTIRAIENGKNRSPHESTLRALARGLRLNDVDTDRLLGVSENIRSLRTFDELLDHGYDLSTAMSKLSVHTHNDIRQIFLRCHVRVGATRRVDFLEREVVIEALRDGVNGCLVFQSGDQSIDARLIQIDQMEGCDLTARHYFPEWNAVLFELSVGTRLNLGETRVFRYRLDMGSAPPDEPALAQVWHGLGDSDGITQSFSRTLAMHVFQVTFAGDPPSRVWEWRGVKDLVNAGNLSLDTWQSAHLFAQNQEPGNYGIGWSWD